MEAPSKEMCQKVEVLILQDRRVKISVTAGHFSWHSFQYHSFSLGDFKGQLPMGATNVEYSDNLLNTSRIMLIVLILSRINKLLWLLYV